MKLFRRKLCVSTFICVCVILAGVVGLLFVEDETPSNYESLVKELKNVDDENSEVNLPSTDEKQKLTRERQKKSIALLVNNNARTNIKIGNAPKKFGAKENPVGRQRIKTVLNVTNIPEPVEPNPPQVPELPDFNIPEKPEEPDEPDQPEPPIHTHEWGEYHYLDEEYHEKACVGCEAKDTQLHEYSNWEYFGNYLKRTCAVCKHVQYRWYQPPEPPTPPVHHHTWGPWASLNDDQDERICLSCGTKDTQLHDFICIESSCEDRGDTHFIVGSYSCSKCNFEQYNMFSEEHQYNDWKYSGNNIDGRDCIICNHQETRNHQHTAEPENLEYVFKASNGDGTHKFEASYTCTACNETVVVSKNEACGYEYTSYRQTGINDTHIEIKECKTCGNQKETEGECVPTGELKFIKIYAQVYEYYDCALCGDRCKRVYHMIHKYGEWIDRDDDTHIRYCGCIEVNEKAYHDFNYDNSGADFDIFTCKDCAHTETKIKHDHGHGVRDEMDLMELVMSPAYNELIDKGQISNPHPSPESYCSRYDFRCSVCKLIYSIYYYHDFVDGKCRRGYCGHIEQNPGSNTLEAEDKSEKTKLESEIKPVETKPEEEANPEEETQSEEEIKLEEETKPETDEGEKDETSVDESTEDATEPEQKEEVPEDTGTDKQEPSDIEQDGATDENEKAPTDELELVRDRGDCIKQEEYDDAA